MPAAADAGRTRRSMTQTTSHTPRAIVTMTKLGGRLNIADIPTPSHTDIKLITVETSIAADGFGVSMIAVAAGVTTSAKSSRVPTAWTAMVMARPSSAMKIIDNRRTGNPLASATWMLTEVYSSGR